MRKILRTVFTLSLFFVFLQAKAQLTIGTVDAGPYTPGSTIAATFTIGSTATCIPAGNNFNLYLSDATGNFVSTMPIGVYNGFYATFVNGVIPAGTPAGTGYKLRIQSTSLGINSTESAAFEIKAGTPVTAKISSTASTISNNPVTFGNCNTDQNSTSTPFRFINESTAPNVTATVTNALNPGTPATLTYTAVNQTQTYNAAIAHYTMFVKAVMADGTVGTQAYFLVNNLAVTAFTTTSGNTVCYPTGAFEYRVDVTTDDGIKVNFPGNTYKIDWGDGTSNEYTFCDIMAAGGRVSHSFTKSSCGLSYQSGNQTTYNAFGVNVGVMSPFCGAIGTPLSTSARVVTRPENIFSHAPIACLNDIVVFSNQSIAGQRPNTNSSGCTDNTVFYNWYVDNVLIQQDRPRSYNFQYAFTTTGIHTIRLSSSSDGSCQADDVQQTICIQNPPQPSFTLPSNKICLTPGTLTPVNTSVTDLTSCPGTTVTRIWAVSPSAGVTYVGGTNANSINPQFKFAQIGIYNITLTIQTGTCQVTTTPQKVVVDSEPQVTLSPDISLCTIGNLTFNPTATATRTTVSGTAEEQPDTYTWTVSGGQYNFVTPDGANTKYPTINFTDYTTYTITLTHKNNCNTVTKTQVITFSPSPIPTIAATPSPVCYDAVINLQGTVTNGTYSSFTWSGGGGTFSAPASLTTTYTPTTAERNSGVANIRLTLVTGLTGNCAQVAANLAVPILPRNFGTAASQTICTGNTTSYTPSSSVAGSTYSWTAANADGRATGFSTSGSGPINETITNTNTTANAVVVYTITPLSNGCSGEPYTFTVTVAPRPTVVATATNPTICSNQPAGITLTPNLAGTRYTWTSTATAGITGNTTASSPTTATGINDILTNTGITQGSVTYTITPISSAGCPGTPPVTVTVLIDPAVTVSNAGPDDSICDITSYTLNGNAPVVGSGMWTLTSGQTGVNITNPALYNTSVTGLTGGQTYTFRWTISAAGACAASSDEVTVAVNTPSVAGTLSGNTTVCQNINNGTINLTGYVGTIVNWESSADGGATWQPVTNSTPTLTYTNLATTTQYRVVIQNGSCAAVTSNAVIITVTPASTVALAGADQVICNQPTLLLDGNAPAAGETGLWTMVSGTPNTTFTDASNPKTTVTQLVAGQTYVFRWTITGTSACGPSSDEVTINNLLPLTNSISSPSADVCSGQIITITGSVPTGGDGNYTYLWESSTDGTTWTAISGSTGRDLTYTLTSTLSFRRTVISSACTLASNVIRIIAQPPITNNVIAADQTICTGLIPAGLTGSTPAGGDGNFNYQWQLSTDNGATWTDINAAVFAAYAPPALTITTQYRRVVSTIACSGSLRSISTPVTITIKENAKAEYTYTLDRACTPFVIDASNIKAVPYPDRNASYTWYANDVEIGAAITFPGYTINNSNESVTIKLIATSSLGCTQSEFSHTFSTTQSVAPSFTQSVSSGCGPLVVNFVNTSTSLTAATFRWDFGNGTTSNQTLPAAVTFLPDPTAKDTTYTVTLTATTACGSNSVTSTVFVKAKPISIFSPSRTVGCSPMRVTFSNSSPGGTNTYFYDFGDGTLLTRTDKSDVEHTYTTNVVRDYVVKMVAQNECGSAESSYTIRVSPNTVLPELVVNANEKEGCAPFTVNFYNNTRGANTFRFDFGDGSTLITNTAPQVVPHTFTRPGTYTITLTASNGCSDTTTTESITVLPQPLAAFTADQVLGCPGLAVRFSNTSTDGVSYLWDFGDGTTSTEFEPQHVFNADKEYYTITLTATNILGCTYTAVMPQYIHIVAPPIAAFNVAPSTQISIPNYTFRFEDESTNSPAVWRWDFGDGTTSLLQNPSHTYLDTGSYVVTLRVTNQQGCFTTTFKTVTIIGVPGYLYVPNSFMPGSETPELRVFMAKGSGIKTWTMGVFNKWGQKLWETSKLDDGRPVEWWDGTFNAVPVPQGVYFWKIDVEFTNGTAWKGMTYDSKAPKKTGVIHLIR